MKICKPFLKWAGSKARLMDTLRLYLPLCHRLIEPFCGSCAVMLNTHYPCYRLNDVNPDLINCYQQLVRDPETFIAAYRERVNQPVITAETDYYCIRERFNQNNLPLFYRALYFLFLNRHGFNGLCRYNQAGAFNVPHGRYKAPYFPETEMRHFAYRVRQGHLHFLCGDWREALADVRPGDGIYADPPYLTDNGGFTQYSPHGFDDREHETLAVTLKALHTRFGIPVTVSNSALAHEVYGDLGFQLHEISAPRTIAANGSRTPATEIIATLPVLH